MSKPKTTSDWKLPRMTRDRRHMTRDWQREQTHIDGVEVREIRNVLTGYGRLTELYRADWKLAGHGVDQVFQVLLEPGEVSAWHAHAETTDRLFVSHGQMRIVLYDARQDSSTAGCVNEFLYGSARPAVVVVPPQVWHGVQNVASTPSLITNIVDRAYDYENPDHYRVPVDSPDVPYRFPRSDR